MSGSFSDGDHNESEVVRDALRLAELRELKLQALREHVAQAIKQGGSYTDEEIEAILAADEAEAE